LRIRFLILKLTIVNNNFMLKLIKLDALYVLPLLAFKGLRGISFVVLMMTLLGIFLRVLTLTLGLDAFRIFAACYLIFLETFLALSYILVLGW